MYAGIAKLYSYSYLLAEIHNKTKLIPATFIIYFGKQVPKDPLLNTFGYFMLLKLPNVLADLGIGVIVYRLIKDITKNSRKALFGFVLYLFNPLTIFLSSVWGQSESLITFFGLLAFVLPFYKKAWLSLPMLFISLYLKPNWVVLLPLYLMVLYFQNISPRRWNVLHLRGVNGSRKCQDDNEGIKKYNPNQFIFGLVVSFIIFIASTYPFSGPNVFGFTKDVVINNMLPSAKGTARASVSAFNLYSAIFDIDRTFVSKGLEMAGYAVYVFINVYVYQYLKRSKKLLFPTIF
jgi:hypothetical protein